VEERHLLRCLLHRLVHRLIMYPGWVLQCLRFGSRLAAAPAAHSKRLPSHFSLLAFAQSV
jgi:hypothetical protein